MYARHSGSVRLLRHGRPRKLVLRLGERKVVATQEDVVIEEARRLAGIA